MYSVYKHLRFLSLANDGYKAPTIVQLLADEDLQTSRQGVLNILKKYEATGTIDFSSNLQVDMAFFVYKLQFRFQINITLLRYICYHVIT